YNSLYDKYLFAVIVSGYSGSDIIAQQVLGALCLNKTFMLPPRFCIMQTANDPGEAMKAEGMTARIEEFSQNILLALRGG
ncbi:MAG: NADPH-dependent oxidoreductase, partial [Eubacteriales bacterium]